MASAFFRSRWAAVAFLVIGISLMTVGWSSRPLFYSGLLLWLASFPLYNYFSFKGMCQVTGGKGVWATTWRTTLNVFPCFGLYGFAVYDPLDEEEAQFQFDQMRARRREARKALREKLRQ